MEKKRFIFDLDDTLLKYNNEYEEEFFKEEFGCSDPFKGQLIELYQLYCANYKRYINERLEGFLSFYGGVPIKEGFVNRWVKYLSNMPVELEEGVEDTLEYLRLKNKSLVVLTNWYGTCQEERLKNAKIVSYFDKIYSGEYVLKPNLIAYETSIASYNPKEVVFIGDDLENDYISPRKFGYDAILYDKKDNYPKNLVKIKRINEIKERV